jgi:hypothetical protein
MSFSSNSYLFDVAHPTNVIIRAVDTERHDLCLAAFEFGQELLKHAQFGGANGTAEKEEANTMR